jgi:hypothetical protein
MNEYRLTLAWLSAVDTIQRFTWDISLVVLTQQRIHMHPESNDADKYRRAVWQQTSLTQYIIVKLLLLSHN